MFYCKTKLQVKSSKVFIILQQRFVQFMNKVLYSSETKFHKANFLIYPICAKVNGMQSTLNPTLKPEIAHVQSTFGNQHTSPLD